MCIITRRSDLLRRRWSRLNLEPLEGRHLLSIVAWPGLEHPLAEVEPNDVLTQALDLGDLSGGGRGEAVGSIDNRADGGGDVDWYSFELSQPGVVHLAAQARPVSTFAAVLSLYNYDVGDFGDPFDPLGHRLLAQDVGAPGGMAIVSQPLAAGTYFLAVSGAGNEDFHPLIADSGYAGSTGDYGLQLSAADFPLAPDAGPTLLTANPAPGSSLPGSPLVLRLNFNEPLAPASVVAGQTVSLTFNPDGTFGDGKDQDVPLANVNLSSAGDELQLFPLAPLAPGFYRVELAGDASTGGPTVTDVNGISLGTDSDHPNGADLSVTFQINGIEGNTTPGAPANDSPAGAVELGDVTDAGLVQVAGTIGNDPRLANPAADVDLFHIKVSGPGTYQFQAEVFAGRIGSPLDPGVSLFRLDPATGQLVFVAGNDNTQNTTPTADGMMQPLFADAALFSGVTAGDYYVAVAGTGNSPDPNLGLFPGVGGVFDPNVSGSGSNGFSTGGYVLNLLVQPDSGPPHVTDTSIAEGATLDGPPARIQVHFDAPVNLQQLAYTTFLQTSSGQINAIFVRGADGQDYYPRLGSYDRAAGEATFVLFDALPPGPAELHLSGPLGLTSLGGSPLAGNDPSGDYVVHFTVGGAPRGSADNPLLWPAQEPNDSLAQPQDLGPLFPRELAAVVDGQPGITIERDAGAVTGDTNDTFRFQVLQSNTYLFSLTGTGLPDGTQPVVLDAAGQPLPTLPQGDGSTYLAALDAGTYFVSIGGWSPDQAANVAYQLRLSSLDLIENPTPLTAGPAPALRLRLVTNDAPASPVTTPPSSAPAPTSPPVAAAPLVRALQAASEPAAAAAPPVRSEIAEAAPTVLVSFPSIAAVPLPAPGMDIPTGVLTSLGSGPVGGVRGTVTTNPATAGQFVRLPGDAAPYVQANPLANLLFLMQLGDLGGVPAAEERAEPREAPPATESRSAPVLPMVAPAVFTTPLLRAFEPIFDMIFHTSDWLLELPATLPVPGAEALAPPSARRSGRGAALLGLAATGSLMLAPRSTNREDERLRGAAR